MLDTFLTRSYKGGFIHSKYMNGKEIITYALPSNIHTTLHAKSWRAAQIRITRSLRLE